MLFCKVIELKLVKRFGAAWLLSSVVWSGAAAQGGLKHTWLLSWAALFSGSLFFPVAAVRFGSSGLI